METWRDSHKTWKHGEMRHGNGDMDMKTWTWRQGILKSNGQRKPQRFFLIRFTVCSSCERKFVVCLLVDEETNRSFLFANGTKRTKQTWLRQQDLENNKQNTLQLMLYCFY